MVSGRQRAAHRPIRPGAEAPGRVGWVSVELDRLGLFLRLGRVEVYLCTEADRAWGCRHGPDGFDLRASRLHLVVGTVPR